jgi:hypothetical protein
MSNHAAVGKKWDFKNVNKQWPLVVHNDNTEFHAH